MVELLMVRLGVLLAAAILTLAATSGSGIAVEAECAPAISALRLQGFSVAEW